MTIRQFDIRLIPEFSRAAKDLPIIKRHENVEFIAELCGIQGSRACHSSTVEGWCLAVYSQLSKARYRAWQYAALIAQRDCQTLSRIFLCDTQRRFKFVRPCFCFRFISCVLPARMVFSWLVRALLVVIQCLIPVLLRFPYHFVGRYSIQ